MALIEVGLASVGTARLVVVVDDTDDTVGEGKLINPDGLDVHVRIDYRNIHLDTWTTQTEVTQNIPAGWKMTVTGMVIDSQWGAPIVGLGLR